MERVCFLGRVRPERLAEYRDRHQRVWPEMLAALRETGWANHSQRDMAPYFTELNGRPPDEGFQRIEEIFHLD